MGEHDRGRHVASGNPAAACGAPSFLLGVRARLDPVAPSVSRRHALEPPQLDERLRVVVHTKVEDALVRRRLVRGDDDEPRRLPPAEVAARGLGGVERVEEAIR